MKKESAVYFYHSPNTKGISPIIVDNPHSGRCLPSHFNYCCDKDKLMVFGDLHMEKLLVGLPKKGIPVLEAKIHRAVIDLNRECYDIDPKEVKGGWKKHYKVSNHTKNGFGLVPERLGRPFDMTPIFNEVSRPNEREITKRINKYHKPYHQKLSKIINRAHKANGVSFHLDLHSYNRTRNLNMEDIILGDFNGKTCPKEFRDFITKFLKKEGLSVGINKPFKGAALICRHSNKADKKFSLQIEIARDLYMNSINFAFDDKKGPLIRDILSRLADELHSYTINYSVKNTALKNLKPC